MIVSLSLTLVDSCSSLPQLTGFVVPRIPLAGWVLLSTAVFPRAGAPCYSSGLPLRMRLANLAPVHARVVSHVSLIGAIAVAGG